jgi:hypothetical protein
MMASAVEPSVRRTFGISALRANIDHMHNQGNV